MLVSRDKRVKFAVLYSAVLCPLKKFLSNLKNGGYKYLNDSNGRNELYIVRRRNHRFTEKKYR